MTEHEVHVAVARLMPHSWTAIGLFVGNAHRVFMYRRDLDWSSACRSCSALCRARSSQD